MRHVPDTKLISAKAEALYNTIVERARPRNQNGETQNLDDIEKKRKVATLLDCAQPDKVVGELVDWAMERRVKKSGDAVMDPIETHLSVMVKEKH